MKKHRHFHDKEIELWAWQQNFEANLRLIPYLLAFAILGFFGLVGALMWVSEFFGWLS